MTRKQDGWGWRVARGSHRKCKGRKEGDQRKNSTLRSLQSRPFSVSGPLGPRQEGRRPWLEPAACGSWLGALAAASARGRENRRAWPWKREGRCFLLLSAELERAEPSPVDPARPNFLPQGEFFPALGKHTWLEFLCPGPGAQSFLPSGWSPGEINRLADTKRFDVKNRWQETKNKQ